MSDAESKNRMVFDDDEAAFNPARRAEAELGELIEAENEVEQVPVKEVSVNAERHSSSILDQDTGRTRSRVLFVTSDTGVLEKGSSVHNHYVSLANVFDEVHVMVLGDAKLKERQLRIANSAWVYTISSTYWWSAPWKSRQAAIELLVFSEAVRPDVVVATDPYVAGVSAYFIASALARPLQVQVHEDPFSEGFSQTTHYKRRRRLARYVLKRVSSVRTTTDQLAERLRKRFKKIADIGVLPQFYDLSGIRTAVPQFDLHERYKDFVFIILTFAPLTADSYLHGIITALRSQLMSPRIGLVIIGSGPAKQLFKEKVKLIGIERSVAFVEPGEDMTSFLKTADLLIEGGAGVDAERNVLRAAAAGLPVITAETEQIASLFQDGTNAFVCPKGDVECLGKKTNLFLNQSSYRSLFSRTAADIVATRVDEDPVRYYETYRDTIECIISST